MRVDGRARSLPKTGPPLGVPVLFSAYANGLYDWALARGYSPAVSAKSTYTTYVVARAFDRDTATTHHSGDGSGNWVQCDFGVLRVWPRHWGIRASPQSDWTPASFKMQGSNDGVTWTDLYTHNGVKLTLSQWNGSAMNGTAYWRYVRHYSLETRYLQFAEIEWWGYVRLP